MNKYIVISFAFMAFAFYELSGGDDFVPRKAELIAAAERDAKTAAVRIAEQTRPQPIPSTSDSAIVREVSLRRVAEPAPVPAEPQKPTVSFEASQTPVTIVSLEQSGALFEQPALRLSTTAGLQDSRPNTRDAASGSTFTPADIREVSGTRVNVRKGPGTTYGIVVSLPQGTPVAVIETDASGWVKLRTVEDEVVGWMAEYLLTAPTG